jgi:hypothetical protein
MLLVLSCYGLDGRHWSWDAEIRLPMSGRGTGPLSPV